MFDSYLHCGISKYLPLETVVRAHLATGVVGGILVQHLGEFDNTYIVESAEAAGASYRAVVLVDQSTSQWQGRLIDLSKRASVAGLRVVATGESWEAGAAAAAEAGLVVVFYLPAGARPVREAIDKLACEHPGARFVLSHLGATRLDVDLDPDVTALAERENIFLQVSGFGMWSKPPYSEANKLVRNLIRAYGPLRIVWGSNFPVCKLETEVRYAVSDPWRVGEPALDALLYANAIRLWGIGASA